MKASDAREGVRYLSKTGAPVAVIGRRNGKVLIKFETTGATISVNGEYELKPIVAQQVPVKEGKPAAKGKMKAPAKPEAVEPKSLAGVIDPLLLAGGHTVKEIAIEVFKKAAALAKDKDVEANIRARMVSYTRKGWQVAKDDKKRVRVLQKKG